MSEPAKDHVLQFGSVVDLRGVVHELESEAAAAGWDRPASLFALVPTAALLAREPGLAEALAEAGPLTPVEQEQVEDADFEQFLTGITWPAEVAGVAAVAERLVLPSSADDRVPADAAEAADYVAAHPEREEVRIVVAVTREGTSWSALRMRSHDTDDQVLSAPDLIPGLLSLLRGTLDADMESADAESAEMEEGSRPEGHDE